jgi:hypothetical protein
MLSFLFRLCLNTVLKKDIKEGAVTVAHTYNSSSQEVEAGGPRVPGQPGRHIETLPEKKAYQVCLINF